MEKVVARQLGYYQTNGEVLKFDIFKNQKEILFNHYISQKENLGRKNGELPRGKFYMTINAVCDDMNITYAEARGLIKKFTAAGIITNVYTPKQGCKSPSIWQYNSVAISNNEENNDGSNEKNNEKASNMNAITLITNNDIDNESNNELNSSKKENIKRKRKNTNEHFQPLINSYTDNRELAAAIMDFLEMRRAMKKTATDRAVALIFKRLDTLSGGDASLKLEILNQSIENGWQGVYPLKSYGYGFNHEKSTVGTEDLSGVCPE